MGRARQCVQLLEAIQRKRRSVPRSRAMLVGISGIDGSGKSTIAPRLVDRLNSLWLKAVLIRLDDWHSPPEVRFNRQRPAETFYEKGLRHEDLFSSLVLPLQQKRSVAVEAVISRQPAERPFRHRFEYRDVDVIVVEGIFIFKKQFQRHFDFRCWIECPFEIALERALARNQEGLLRETLIRDYETIYFAAQRLHFEKDKPWEGADFVFDNAADASVAAA